MANEKRIAAAIVGAGVLVIAISSSNLSLPVKEEKQSPTVNLASTENKMWIPAT